MPHSLSEGTGGPRGRKRKSYRVFSVTVTPLVLKMSMGSCNRLDTCLLCYHKKCNKYWYFKKMCNMELPLLNIEVLHCGGVTGPDALYDDFVDLFNVVLIRFVSVEINILKLSVGSPASSGHVVWRRQSAALDASAICSHPVSLMS